MSAYETFIPPSPLNTAVLFLVFNRPDVTAQVFDSIRKAKPPRLYVAADGPRSGREGEAQRCAEVRRIATAVDWPCEVQTLFREQNLGCKRAVSEGISWFFEHEEQGIILEDDCLPNQDFFGFCENLLNRYAKDDRVWVITGDNFQNGQKRGVASYYFSKYNHCWGWASWRRAWQKSDMDIRFWPEWKISSIWQALSPDQAERRYWEKIFNQMYRAEIDTWDYPWTASVWFNGGLTATPNVNLVSNLGFGPDSTHTTSSNSPQAKMATSALGEITHPASIFQDSEADRYVFDHVLGGRMLRLPFVLYSFPRRVAGMIYRVIKRKLQNL